MPPNLCSIKKILKFSSRIEKIMCLLEGILKMQILKLLNRKIKNLIDFIKNSNIKSSNKSKNQILIKFKKIQKVPNKKAPGKDQIVNE